VRRRLFGISLEEVRFARRGFHGEEGPVRERLERVPRRFAQGYHAVLEDAHFSAFIPTLDSIGPEDRGFAYEGAAMALALLDYLTPWRPNRIAQFLQGAGDAHAYVVNVGVGWAMARVHGSPGRARARLDALLGWLALDGYGFHEGFFHWARYQNGQPPLARLDGYERRAFDQGLGRSLWFIEGADASRVAESIEGFPEERRADLWSGIGLACTYAGGVGEEELRNLKSRAGGYRAPLAQGSAFAAQARRRAGIVVPHTEVACRVCCEMAADDAAQVTDTALENIQPEGSAPAYEVWRRRIQARFS
jgi:hypothetical protein